MTKIVLNRALVSALLLDPGTLVAQGAMGRLEGRVTAAGGAPLADAQVHVVGSAFWALTDPRGRFFINHIPAGSYDIRTALIGFRPVEIRGLRILADQSITQEVQLEPAPLQLREIVVLAAENPLVPRDEVTSKQRLDGELARELPVDAVEDLVALQPGVVASEVGLSIRGGREDEAAVYVDGVPVSPGYRGFGFLTSGTALSVATNALEQGSVTTGSPSAEFGNAQAGIISIVTRSGGARLGGAVSYESDEPFGTGHSLGFNRVEASVGGPLVGRLRFSLSGVLQGQKAEPVGFDADLAPVFVPAGVDTTVAVPVPREGSPLADTTYVDIHRFAIGRGSCDAVAGSAHEGIRGNYGLECQGIRTPGTPRSRHELHGKLSYSYGQGSQIALSYLKSLKQARIFDHGNLYNPAGQFGERAWSRALLLTWVQNLSRTAERALSLEASLAWQADRGITSPLTLESERRSRDPFGGFLLRPLDFRFDFESFPLTDELVDNVRYNRAGTRRTPYDIDHSDQYRFQDQYRNNAYGLAGWSEAGGPEGDLLLYREDRYLARMLLDAQVDPRNRIKLGGELTGYEIDRYQAALTGEFAEIYLESPVRWDLFAEHRLDLGDVIVVGGLRYDAYRSRAERPFLLDTVQASGTFGEYVFGFDPAYGDDGAEFGGRPLFITRPDEGHGVLSPRIQVSFPVTHRTNFRLSYGHQVQAPDLAVVLHGVNIAGIGNDLDFGRTISYEFGIRHAFNDDLVLDIAAYSRDHRSNASLRTFDSFDPVTRTPSRLVQRFTNADFGHTRGVDVRLDSRLGPWFNGTIGYSYQSAKSTGSDPFTNQFRSLAGLLQTAGDVLPPPQAIVPPNFSRPHTLTGAFSITVPEGWRRGTVLGTLTAQVGLFATLRYTSGTPYTGCATLAGNESAISGEDCAIGGGSVNAERRPAIKEFDLRLTKGFDLGRLGITAYLDARNLFNFRNLLEVFAMTGGPVSAVDRQARWASDSSLFAAEAEASGVRHPDDPELGTTEGTIDLTFGGQGASGCGAWVTGGAVPAPPNCVYLIRAEQRFGNGDLLFTITEQRQASDANYAVDRGPHAFTGPPRLLRAGLEVTF